MIIKLNTCWFVFYMETPILLLQKAILSVLKKIIDLPI